MRDLPTHPDELAVILRHCADETQITPKVTKEAGNLVRQKLQGELHYPLIKSREDGKEGETGATQKEKMKNKSPQWAGMAN